MCADCETPVIELHDIDGSVIGIRRDLIALVKRSSADDNPLGGSVIATDLGKLIVLETPGEILRLLHPGVAAQFTTLDTIRAEKAPTDAAGTA